MASNDDFSKALMAGLNDPKMMQTAMSIAQKLMSQNNGNLNLQDIAKAVSVETDKELCKEEPPQEVSSKTLRNRKKRERRKRNKKNRKDSSETESDSDDDSEAETGTESDSEAGTESDDELVQLRTDDIYYDLAVSLEEFYTGTSKQIKIPVDRLIKGRKEKKRIKLEVPIEAGMKDGQEIIFKGKGDQAVGYESGDIIITLHEEEHEVFERRDDNLMLNVVISLYEAFKLDFTFKHLDGRVVRVVNSGEPLHTCGGIKKLEGEGMPTGEGDKGDLYIRFSIDLPETLKPEDEEAMKKLFEPLNKCEEVTLDALKLSSLTESDAEELGNDAEDDDEVDSDDEAGTEDDSDDEVGTESDAEEETGTESEM